MLISAAAFSQSIRVAAPASVRCGENFRVEYVIDTQDVSDFRSGIQTTEGYEVIAGPYESRSSSYHMVNGHTSSSSTLKITYTLYALKEGDYTFPAARATIGGKSVSAKPFSIKISGKAPSGSGAPKMHGEDNSADNSPASISPSSLFIKVSANRQRVKEQEAVLVTYKVYTLVELTQLEGKMPDLKDCHVQEVELPQQKSFHIENVGGKNYRCVTWSQYVVYPQRAGTVEIPSIKFKGIVVVQNKNVDPLEAFLNGGAGYTELKREIVAPSVKIAVEELPDKPADFSGGVGKMKIKASVDKNAVNAGDPVTLKVEITGNGNLKLLTFPEINLPKDFDKYDPKPSDNTRLTQNGIEGSVAQEYIIVPRNKGHYVVPPIKFTYYDTSSNGYKTLSTDAIKIDVEGDNAGESGSKRQGAINDNDIRGLMPTTSASAHTSTMFFATKRYWAAIAVPFVMFIVLLLTFRRRAIRNADIIGQRGRKANKVAGRRLKRARGMMEKGESEKFYDEVLRALWGYAADKMNIPTESLSRENIASALEERGINEATRQTFIEALDECEFERYAPGDKTGNMQKTYDAAHRAIIEAEEQAARWKKKEGRSKKSVKGFSLILVALLMHAATASADTSADSLYEAGHYQAAISEWEKVLAEGDGRVYYNLGCAYYRTEHIGKSILCFERALKYMPGNGDVKHNLRLARQRTKDKIYPSEPFILLQWLNGISGRLAVDSWAVLSIVLIALSLVLMLAFLFAPQPQVRRWSLWGSMLAAVACVIAILMAAVSYSRISDSSRAVIVAPQVELRKSPAVGSASVKSLHEGTEVKIVDTAEGCYGVRLSDGETGWINTEGLEII